MKARKADLVRSAAAAVALSAVLGWTAADAGKLEMPKLLGARGAGFTTLERNTDGYWSQPALVLARSAKEWDDAMARLEAAGAFLVLPGPAAPSVDWTRQAVLLVTAGMGAYESVEVRQLERAGSRLVVRVVAEPAGCRYGDYSPYHLVAVDRSLLRMATRVEASYECPGGPAVPPMAASVAAGVDENAGMPAAVAASWAGVKALYR
jgi:hypothetical protein